MGNFTGGSGNDSFTSTGNTADSITGAGGNDTLDGGGGNDTIDGGTGNDSLAGGSGDDVFLLSGVFGNDTIAGGENSETVGDTVNATAVTLNTTLTFTGGEAGTLTGGISTATFSQIERFLLGAGSDTVNGAAATLAMYVDAGGGSDSMLGGAANDTLLGGIGSDTISGGNGNDSLDGGADNDTLIGGAGNDTLLGRSGDDFFTGGAGADSIVGGSGTDTADYSASGAGVTIDLLAGTGTGGDAAGDRLSGIEGLVGSTLADTFVGTAGAETMSSGAGDDKIGAGGGNDTIDAGDGNDSVWGGEGNDTIFAGAGNDYVDADAMLVNGGFEVGVTGGNWAATAVAGWHSNSSDAIEVWSTGQSGVNSTDGGNFIELDYDYAVDSVWQDVATVSGNSYTLSFSAQARPGSLGDSFEVYWRGTLIATVTPGSSWTTYTYTVTGSGGTDRLEFRELSGQNNTVGNLIDNVQLVGVGGNDSVDGGAGNDTLLGGAGNDTINGGDGSDSVAGGDGDDRFVLSGTFGADTISGGEAGETSGDTIDSTAIAANQTLTFTGGEAGTLSDGSSTATFSQIERFLLGSGNDTVNGAAATSSMYVDGGAGADSMSGGSGNDTLLAGIGNDTLNGGAGADSMTGGDGDDRFLGITAGDVVDGSEDPSNTDTDILDLFGSGWTKANTTIVFNDPTHENGTVYFFNPDGTPAGSMAFTNIETVVPCFTPGTMIETDRGPRAVETLQTGDLVLTMDHGLQPVRWIGRRDLTRAELARQQKLRPVMIRAGALGPGLPARDMRVSPQHRLLMTGAHAELISGEAEALAPAIFFVGQPGIVQDAAATGISYIHLMFDRHEIVQSDGLWSESFQPGSATMSGMDLAQREEILSLFPGLPAAGALAYPAARSTLKRYEVQQILAS